ncbi:trafficking protein Mon1-domain-containing protein [Epithele typhae]|uniref:trafficking protein Mon1-domain-containing protein n=1 Tax=Epithele typhae TaxID=378194 RepID=UPI0020079E0E|nr:trafficking protein Mon1-domain-containing protein [Epithele typhae]KAH9922852.1 trafficking protein Mon1-domain-containing protein [Epithele typhae]
MSTTPRRSRTPTRVPSYPGTPDLGRSPSRLATPPAIRSVASVSSFRVYSHGSSSTHTPGSVAPTAMEGGGSSSSPSGAEGIMIVQEPDADVDLVDGDEGSAAGIVESRAGNEESKKILREQLRRTLSKKESFQAERYTTRQYFVLTDAGKPVFVSDRDANSDGVTSMLGVVQALISIFLDDNDKLRSINSRDLHIVFLLRPPLYYVCVSSWGEPESVARFHLEYLHLQILSIVSAEQLRRMFEQRRNFDLRRLLGGAEPFLYSLLARLEWDLAMSTSSLHCLKLDPVLRKSVADILVPKSKIKDILYVIVIAQGRVITLVRPRKHSIHPSGDADLHILINTIHSPSILNNSAAASWLPVCLPKFNASAFVNAYVMFLPREDAPEAPVKSSSTSLDDAGSTRGKGPAPADTADVATSPRVPTVAIAPSSVPDVAVVAVSGSADFDAVRSWCDTVSRRLNDDGLSRMLARAIAQGDTEYSVSNLGVPGLRHFVYKSRSHVQLTMPTFEEPYDDLNEKRRLVTLYQTVYDAIHAKSGQERTLKLQYVRTSQECVMGWITQPFELYLALSPRLPKSAAVGAANAIARWVQKEEKQLFLKDAPVF